MLINHRPGVARGMTSALKGAQNRTLHTKDMINLKPTPAALKGAALLCIGLTVAAGLRAQSSTPPPASASAPTTAQVTTTTTSTTETGAQDAQVTTLEKFTVSDVPLEEQILPTVRP